MNKYTIYFEGFKDNNRKLVEKILWENGDLYINFIDISYINNFTKKDEAIVHASMLYATNLLSQIIASFVFNIFSRREDEGKRSVFPEIYGRLSTAYAHVCPSIPATYLIYSRHKLSKGDMDWSKSIEKETWLKYFDEFENGVKWVIDNLELLLPYISNNHVEESEKERIKKYMLDEHLRINSEIRDGTVSYERISNY